MNDRVLPPPSDPAPERWERRGKAWIIAWLAVGFGLFTLKLFATGVLAWALVALAPLALGLALLPKRV